MAKDPYKYFRAEAREILEGLGRDLLGLEKAPTPEIVPRLLRLAHTLKGAARVVRQPKIAEHTHALEEALEPFRGAGTSVPRDVIDRSLKLVDAIAAQVALLDAPETPGDTAVPEPAPAAPPTRAEPPIAVEGKAARPAEELPRMVRAELAEMDALLDGVAEVGVNLRSIRRAVGSLERARHLADLLIGQLSAPLSRDLSRSEIAGVSPKARAVADELRDLVTRLERELPNRLDQVERETQQVRDAAERLLLSPASGGFAALERSSRDVAQSLGKSVTFEASGGDVRVDGHVLGVAQGALVQMVRNAVAHGIEPPAVRARAGKPASGRVEVAVIRRGDRVAFVCRDDGGGVDLEAVRRVVVERGLAPAAAKELDAEELVRVVLGGGVTTAGAVTQLSGRGIGLDIVRDVAAQLGGEVNVRTGSGGTTVELVVPVSLSAVDALVVEAGGARAAIPLHSIRRTVRLSPGDITRAADGDSIVHEGKVIPFLRLTRALGADALPARTERAFSAVLVGTHATARAASPDGSALAAIGVDRLFGTANVVMRSLPALAVAHPLVAGASLDAEGNPQLVLDPDRLVAAAVGMVSAAPVAPEVHAPVLVIDDSLTTRMLEKSILESAGYEVDLATSAEEALEKAAQRRYRLFLVDVEMPGMDGFTFVAQTRRDPVLGSIPAILVTSLDSVEDRRRGAEAGAEAYIVKSEFDQGHLLTMIRKLLG